MTRIVLVDDNESILTALREYLSTCHDLEVAGTTNTPRTASDLIDVVRPDLVITDLEMPDMNGLDLTRQLRRTHPELAIIVLTGRETSTHRRMALEAGADAFVGKTSALTSLVSTIQSLRPS